MYSRNTGKGGGREGGKRPIICHKCGEPGHIAPQCRSGGSGRSGGKSDVRCFHCNETGHKANECPKKGETKDRGDDRSFQPRQETSGTQGTWSSGGGRGHGRGPPYEKKSHQSEGFSQSQAGRGSGRGGGPNRGRNPDPPFFKKNVPDPYKMNHSKEHQDKHYTEGWKELAEEQDDIILHKRPKVSDKWDLEKVTVAVNHFQIKSTKNENEFPFPTFYHYDIAFEIVRPKREGAQRKGKSSKGKPKAPIQKEGQPQGKKLPKHLTKAILDYLIPKIREAHAGQAIVTDGAFNLYSTEKFDGALKHELTIEDLVNARIIDDENDNATVEVVITPAIDSKTGEIHIIDTTAIAAHFKEKGSLDGYDFSAEERQMLEAVQSAIVKGLPNYQYFPVGRSTMVKCEGAETHDLGGGLNCKKGISATVVNGATPTLNVDIANSAMWKNLKVLDILEELGVYNPINVRNWRQNDLEKAANLKTCKISYQVRGLKRSGNVINVPKLSSKSASFFWKEKNKQVTVLDYFNENYGLVLEYPDGPVLEIRKKENYVPAELCTVKDGQSINRKLDGNQTTKMLTCARKDPDDLKKDIEAKVAELNLQNNLTLNDLNVKIVSKMLEVKAKILVPPTLRYGSSDQDKNMIAHATPKDGVWEVWKCDQNFSFYRPAKIEKWGVLSLCWQKECDKKMLADFANKLRIMAEKRGVGLPKEPILFVDSSDRRWSTPEQNSENFTKIFKNVFKDCQLVIVVLSQKGDPIYSHVKHAAEIEYEDGMLTDCVVLPNVKACLQGRDANLQNIINKLNFKLNGINHVPVPPLDKKMAEKYSTVLRDCPTLLLAADVTHPPPGSKKMVNGKEFTMPSYAAVVGSLDVTGMPCMTEMRAQRKADRGAAEVVQDLENIVVTMIKRYVENTKDKEHPEGIYPRKIIYLRDGVGRGQFREVIDKEMNAIRNACDRILPDYEPKVTLVMVQKRNKERMFKEVKGGKFQNVEPGTTIDTEIVDPIEMDFYMVSHFGLMGTSRPTHYYVPWDDSEFRIEEIESLIFISCHMYGRCNRSVRIPGPTYYAHWAADRAKKLCEGFEGKNGQEPTVDNLNAMLRRTEAISKKFPMFYI